MPDAHEEPRRKPIGWTQQMVRGELVTSPKFEPPAPPPPLEPPAPRPWPYSPAAGELEAWANSAIWHFIAIRATGSTPTNGGPSAPVQMPATAEALQSAAETAENYWPAARAFDLIGSDLEYRMKQETEGLAAGMNRLRDAQVITTFNITDRTAPVRPLRSSAFSWPNPPAPIPPEDPEPPA